MTDQYVDCMHDCNTCTTFFTLYKDCIVNLMLSSCRPFSASACSDGPDTSQYVHTPEDAQRQSQPQAAVHGEETMASMQTGVARAK